MRLVEGHAAGNSALVPANTRCARRRTHGFSEIVASLSKPAPYEPQSAKFTRSTKPQVPGCQFLTPSPTAAGCGCLRPAAPATDPWLSLEPGRRWCHGCLAASLKDSADCEMSSVLFSGFPCCLAIFTAIIPFVAPASFTHSLPEDREKTAADNSFHHTCREAQSLGAG